MKVQHLISTILRETEGGTGRERRRGILPAVFLMAEWRESERVVVKGELNGLIGREPVS